MTLNKKLLPVLLIVTLAVGFAGGLWFARAHAGLPVGNVPFINQNLGKPAGVDFSEFWDAWNDLQQKYVDSSKLNTQAMLYGAISGMVNAIGDPYTVFFEPTANQQFQEQISGSFAGVGLEIDEKNNVLTVIAPIKDTPGYNAGIKTDDKILKINGTSTSGLDVDTAVSDIRGKAGTKVTLTVQTGTATPRDITLTRETINVPTVQWNMIDQGSQHIAYMQIYEFNENVESQFKTAVDQILKSNATGLVVDLRGNPGGLLDSAVNLAGYFLDKNQLVVSAVYGNGSSQAYNADGDSSLEKLPTVLLVDGGSASASEILAGALHDDKHIRLVGVTTYGKGSVQELENFNDGSSLKVTIAKWYTPAGINISLKGLTPDISVPLTDAQQKTFVVGDPANDPQLQAAINALK